MHKKRSTTLLTMMALFAVLAIAAQPKEAGAASALRMLSENNREMVWSLNADRVLSAAGGTVLEAFGKVELQLGEDYLRADFARYYSDTHWVYLYGNIEVRMGEDLMNAQEAEFNLQNKTGWLNDGRIFLAENNTYLAADRINKYRGDVYSFKDLKLTTCDDDVPAWSFEADTGVMEVEGYAQLWGTRFQVKDRTVMYSPYLVVPAKTTRQSGFLAPDLGRSSKLGYFYTQPFFWVIDDSRDATLTETYMSDRGFLHGVNYRSRRSEDESLWLSFNYLDDRQTVDHPDDKYYSGDGLLRTNEQRYWLRGMYDVRLPADPLFRLRADVDYVSDQYYLRDFKRGLAGYNQSRDAMFNLFSRDIREIDSSRQSGLMIFRDWDRVGVYLSGTYEQQPYLGHGNTPRSQDNTVQHLPEFNTYLQQGRILKNIPLEVSGTGQGAYFYRRDGDRGTRLDLTPKLTLPLSNRYGSIIGSASLHSTWYRTEAREHHASDEKSRYLPEYEVAASTEFAKIYAIEQNPLEHPGDSRWTSLKHSIVPRLNYLHIPSEDQATNPFFTDYDRLAPRHELTYSIENVVTRKRERMLSRTDPQSKEVENYTETDYLDVVRLRVEQAYSIYEARRNHERDIYPREPWRDLMAELTLSLDENLSLFTRSYWTPSKDSITSHSHGIVYTVPEIGRFTTSLTYRKPVDDYYRRMNEHQKLINETLTTIKVGADLNVFGPWAVSAYYDWDVKGQGKDEKGFTLLYNHQCFTLGGQIILDEDDTIFRLYFSLIGLGM